MTGHDVSQRLIKTYLKKRLLHCTILINNLITPNL